jgi:hypothetical protein
VTGVRIAADPAFKGHETAEVQLLGGAIGSRREFVSDQPALRRGARYLFFLDDQGRPIGGPQGAVEVKDGVLVVTRVTVGDVAEALAATTLSPQQSRAFPELRDASVRAAQFAAIDAQTAPLAQPATTASTGTTAAATGAPSIDAETAPSAQPATTVPAGTTAAATTAPSIDAISPDDVAAGTGVGGSGTVVEIDGSGFGTSPGKVEVAYDPHAGSSFARWRVAPTMWTNTRVTFKVPVFTDSTGYPGAPGTGSVRITTASGVVLDSPALRVGYAFDGDYWASAPSPIIVNPQSQTALSMVQAAIAAWADAGSPVSYGGQTSSPVGPPKGDGTNEIGWGPLSSGTLAQTTWLPDAAGHVVEEHIIFNTMYAWGDGSGVTYDVQSIALHELGHWVVLRDKYSPNDFAQVMYGYASKGVQKRALSPAELDSVRYVYGSDRVAPVTSVSLASSAPMLNSWTSGDVTVTVTPPADANLRATRYRIDYGAAASTTATTELPFTTEGFHDVMVWSTDDAGNNETPSHRSVGIDRTPPTSSSDATTIYAGSATIKLTGSDSLSGLSQLQWRPLGASGWTTNSTITTSSAGTHVLEFRGVDRAGNPEEPHVITFEVLPVEPTALQLSTASQNVMYGTTVSIAGTLTTNGLGLVGQTVQLQTSVNGITRTPGSSHVTTVGGGFSFPVRMASSTYYRVTYFGGTVPGTAYAAVSAPPSVRIGSTAYLTYPSASRVGARTYDLSAMLMPRHASGSYPVRLYLYHLEHGRWVSKSYVTAKAYNVGTSSTKAVRRYVFPSTGAWRVRSYHADTRHLATWSTYHTFAIH